MKDLTLELLIHHSAAMQHCDLRKYSLRVTHSNEKVTCRVCKKILRFSNENSVYFTIHHLGRFRSVHFEENDLRNNCRIVCGFSKKKIDRFIDRPKFRSTSGRDFTVYRHIKKPSSG